jgi:hypothetical protein
MFLLRDVSDLGSSQSPGRRLVVDPKWLARVEPSPLKMPGRVDPIICATHMCVVVVFAVAVATDRDARESMMVCVLFPCGI